MRRGGEQQHNHIFLPFISISLYETEDRWIRELSWPKKRLGALRTM